MSCCRVPRHMFCSRFLVTTMFLLSTTSTLAQLPPNVRVVDQNANAMGMPIDGKTWDTAFRYLQDGLDAMNVGQENDELWVAAGSYQPNLPLGTCDVDETFELINHVEMDGGFLGSQPGGGETLRSQRNPEQILTILDGGDKGCDMHVSHVVTADSVVELTAQRIYQDSLHMYLPMATARELIEQPGE